MELNGFEVLLMQVQLSHFKYTICVPFTDMNYDVIYIDRDTKH